MSRSNRTKQRQPVGTPVNDLLAELLALKRGEPDKIPPGHLTCEQWARAWNVKPYAALRLLRVGIAKGKVKTVKHRIDTGKKVFPVAHYYQVAVPEPRGRRTGQNAS